MFEYSDKLLEHFANPRHLGRLPEADGWARIGDPGCGDFLEVYIKVKEFVIEDIGFLCQGCPAAVGTSSAMAELALGLPLEEAARITEEDIVRAVGGLPSVKLHCSVLGIHALQAAIVNFLERCLAPEGAVKPARRKPHAPGLEGQEETDGNEKAAESR